MYKKVISTCALALLAFSACTGGTPAEDDTIKIGGLLPLTGDGAAYGEPAQIAAEIALEKVNAEGGINGKNLEIIWEDGKCNGKDAASSVQKLINVDKVQVIFGGFCSSETLGAAPLAESSQVVMLSPGSSSPDITDAGNFIFRNYPSDAAQGLLLANHALENGIESVGMLTEENDYTLGIQAVFTETFEAGGGTVFNEPFLSTDTDFKTQISRLKGEGVDAMFINPQTEPKADLIIKQLQEQGLSEETALYANDVILASAKLVSDYPEFLEGTTGATPGVNSESEDFKYMLATYKTNTGVTELPFEAYTATSYDALNLIAEAITAVGNDSVAIRDWLYQVDGWEGAAGVLTLDENGDPQSGHKLRTVTDGKSVFL